MRISTPWALALICLFAFLGLRAGDSATADLTLAPPSPSPNPPLNVAESNKDGNGNIKVHEQGVVRVEGTVNVGNSPAVQDVRVTNDPVHVTGDVNVNGQGTIRALFEEIYPFDKDVDFEIDIHKFSRVRLSVVVNVSGTVDFSYSTDANIGGSFSVDAGHSHTVDLGAIPGTKLFLFVRDPDGEQVFVKVFGSN